MVMPILTLESAGKIEERIGVRLPDALRSRLATGDTADAWSAFDELLATLHASPLVDGVAIMTFEMDAPEGMGPRILQGLRAAGCRV
jgi:5,10-methylenetetrahydrofolate reductase